MYLYVYLLEKHLYPSLLQTTKIPNLHMLTVHVVDDEIMQQRIIRALLKTHGVTQVQEAINGKEAVKTMVQFSILY